MVNENEFLLHASVMGIYITFLYDILRIFRRVIPHAQVWISAEDILFWIYCAAEVFLLMHHESNGTLRWFAVFGALTGMLLYKKLLGEYFVKYTSFVLGKCLEIVRKAYNIVSKPFRVAGRKASAAAKNGIFIRSRRIARSLGRILKKKLTYFLKVLKM